MACCSVTRPNASHHHLPVRQDWRAHEPENGAAPGEGFPGAAPWGSGSVPRVTRVCESPLR